MYELRMPDPGGNWEPMLDADDRAVIETLAEAEAEAVDGVVANAQAMADATVRLSAEYGEFQSERERAAAAHQAFVLERLDPRRRTNRHPFLFTLDRAREVNLSNATEPEPSPEQARIDAMVEQLRSIRGR